MGGAPPAPAWHRTARRAQEESAQAARRYPVDFDERLAEEGVLLAVARQSAAVQARFHEERDLLYELADEDFREERFRALHASWFVSLGLGERLRGTLSAQPAIVSGTRRCRVLWASSPGGEYADLVRPREPEGSAGEGALPVLVLRVRPRTLLDGDRLACWLRREMLQITDLLDPEFAFDPASQLSSGEPGLEKLVRQRYRVLWEITVDGRLAAAGRLPAGSRERRQREFAAAFPMLSRGAFERLFRGPRPTHATLAALARHPGLAGGGAGGPSAGRCPLCRMPSRDLVSAAQVEEGGLAASIVQSIPDWSPDSVLCRQCFDLLRGRERI